MPVYRAPYLEQLQDLAQRHNRAAQHGRILVSDASSIPAEALLSGDARMAILVPAVQHGFALAAARDLWPAPQPRVNWGIGSVPRTHIPHEGRALDYSKMTAIAGEEDRATIGHAETAETAYRDWLESSFARAGKIHEMQMATFLGWTYVPVFHADAAAEALTRPYLCDHGFVTSYCARPEGMAIVLNEATPELRRNLRGVMTHEMDAAADRLGIDIVVLPAMSCAVGRIDALQSNPDASLLHCGSLNPNRLSFSSFISCSAL